MAHGLQIDVPDLAGRGLERDSLVADLRAGTLRPADLARFRFRVDGDGPWLAHPQVRFLSLPVEPDTPLDGPDIVWQQRVTHSPCGTLAIWHRFSWGRKVESAVGAHDAPDVTSTVAYDLVLRVMEGEFGPRGAAERGAEVEGDFGAMQRLVAVFDQPAFQAATRLAVGPLGPGLRAMAPPPR